MFNIKEELKKIPDLPGVYIMYNKENEIIYVGKSISLKNRVRSYFVKNHKNKKVETLVSQIYRFEYIIVNNETESLVLEANLIKKNRPKYNINLKDDKQYPYIKITNEEFPKIMKVRELKNDKSLYFGPFPDVSDLEELIEISILLYKIRDCKINFDNGKLLKRPCMSYYIDRCDAPCVANIDKFDYDKSVSEVIKFLSGNYIDAKNLLIEKMKEASSKKEYETAIKYRDYSFNIDKLFEKQIFNIKKFKEYHLISYSYKNDVLVVVIFIVNDGLILDRRKFIIKDSVYEEFEEVFSSVIRQFYMNTSNITKEIYVDYDNVDFIISLEEFIKKIGNRKDISVKIPKRGIKLEQLKILKKNAIHILDKELSQISLINSKYIEAVSFIKNLTNIEKINRIESYDISNISGSLNVGTMVVYKNAFKNSKEYRKFRIKTVLGQDDYASHREMLERRLNRLIDSNLNGNYLGFGEKPDIIFIDGGIGHVNTAKSVLCEKNIDIPVIGLVKDNKHRTKGIIYEEKYIDLDINSNIYRFLYDIQEETHRFSIEYHRSLRNTQLKRSILDDIKGIGDKRKSLLFNHFGSISNIKKATIDELKSIDGIDRKTAENIYYFFNEE